MYQLQGSGVKRLSDNAHIPADTGNTDWQQYQHWLREGNTPLPMPEPTIEELAAKERAWRDRMLRESDASLIDDFPCTEEDRKQSLAFRKELRAWPSHEKFPDKAFRPHWPSHLKHPA